MYYLEIEKKDLEYLAPIRHWSHLTLAFYNEIVYIKGFTPAQIQEATLSQIPNSIIYELKENLLFRIGKLVPSKKIASALLWMPICNALPIVLPKYNMNYFGIQEKIKLQMIKSDHEQQAFGLITKIDAVKGFIETLPQVRLQNLKWVLIEDSVLFLGTPLLPISAQTYWKKDNFLFPTGYTMEFDILFPFIKEQLCPEHDQLILFQNNNTYLSIPIEACKPLTISSFRLTVND